MRNDGKWLEKAIQKVLQEFMEESRSFFHRFPDSRTARALIPPQPGDYLWLLPNTSALLLEVKSTDESANLNSLLDRGQCGKHRLWHRAGHRSAFIYGDRAKDQLMWFDGYEVLNTSRLPRPLWAGDTDKAKEMLSFISNHFAS